MFLSAGQASDYQGARARLSSIPPAGALLADRGCGADWFRNALIERGIARCILSHKGRKPRSRMTLTSIANTTGPKTPSPASKTGGVSHPATTAAQSSSSPLHTRRNRHHLSSVQSLRFKPRIDFLCQSPMRVAHGALRKACAACEHVQGVMPQASPQPWYGSSPAPLHPRHGLCCHLPLFGAHPCPQAQSDERSIRRNLPQNLASLFKTSLPHTGCGPPAGMRLSQRI